jgi:hypothetical protein
MAKGNKYIALTKYLLNCGLGCVSLSFKEIDELVGGLPQSAYDYPAPWSDGHGGPLSYGWLNAGFSASVDFHRKKATFKRTANAPINPLNKGIDPNHSVSRPFSKVQLAIGKAKKNILKYHETTLEGIHTRYLSWVHCYKAFRENRNSPDKKDFLSLHLAWFLASWGMLRNSPLLDRDYLVHRPIVEVLVSGKYEAFFQNGHTPDLIDLIMDASKTIRESYVGISVPSVSDTLITKILLGVFGCAPAYDRFFIFAARKYNICSGSWNEDSLRSIWQYYEQHREEFEKIRQEITVERLHYPPMKLMDMGLWQIGFDELKQRTA